MHFAGLTSPSPPQQPPLRSTARTVSAMILREMATTYGRSPGGWLWAVLEPVAAIALLSFAFSLAFKSPSLGTSFPYFYATGFLPYMLFHDVSQKVAVSVRFSRPLFSFAAVRITDALLARFILNFLTHLLIVALVLTVIARIWDLSAQFDLTEAAATLCSLALLTAGVGTLNCYLFASFPAWERLWSVALRPLFIISGVIFLFEDVPVRFQPILEWNPLFHITGAFRGACYQGYDPRYVDLTFVCFTGLAALVVGLYLLNAHGDEVALK